MAQTAALFLAYSSFQNVIRSFCHEESLYGEQSKPKLTIPQIGVAAAGAGFITSFILYVVFNLQISSERVLSRRSN